MINEFSRTELLLGEEGIGKLKQKTIMVLGVGGVGSHCIEALARCGVGKLILVDNDTVSLTNINRQAIAFHSTVGQYKTKVMKERIKDICPETEVVTYETFVLPENVDDIFTEKPDYIVDAIDTVTAKLSLAAYAKEHGISMISSMGTGNKLHPELFQIADIEKTSVCPLCRVMRKELKARGIKGLTVLFSTEKPLEPDAELSKRLMEEELSEGSARRSIPGSTAFVPPAAGLMIAGKVVRDLTGMV